MLYVRENKTELRICFINVPAKFEDERWKMKDFISILPRLWAFFELFINLETQSSL